MQPLSTAQLNAKRAIALLKGDSGETYCLSIGDEAIAFDAVTLYALARVCMSEAEKLPVALWSGRLAVCADLTYSDFDDDQSTQCYHWSAVIEDGGLVDAAEEAVELELSRTAAFEHVAAYTPAYPENWRDIEADTLLRSVVEVRANLRSHLVAHESDSILDDLCPLREGPNYWTLSGFSDKEVDELSAHIEDGLFDDVEYGANLLEVMAAYCKEDDDATMPLIGMPGLADTDLFLKLRRWITGEDLTVVPVTE